jgi:hypothetical protein
MPAVLLLLCLLLPPAHAEEGVIASLDFESRPFGCATLDPLATLSLTTAPGVAFEGKGALELTCPPFAAQPRKSGAPGSVLISFLPSPDLKGVSLALWSAQAAPLQLQLMESMEGPRYGCVVYCPGQEWQEVRLGLADFSLDPEGPASDRPTPDPARVCLLSVVNLAAFLETMGQQNPMIYYEPGAEQTVRLDNVKLLSQAPPPARTGNALVSYSLPLRNLLFIGGVRLAMEESSDDEGHPALQLAYTVPARTVFGIVHRIARGDLAGCTGVRLRMRSSGQATFGVMLEEQRSAKEKCTYIATTTFTGLEGFKTVEVPFSSFQLEGGGNDPDGHLNPEQVGMVLLADLSVAGGAEDLRNIVWLESLEAAK